MLASGLKLLAYRFDGYWKDVGTIQSLWEANMELLDEDPKFVLDDEDWKIYGKNPVLPPHYISETAKISNSYITEGCEIYGTVENSVLFRGVKVGKGAKVKNCVLMQDTVVGEGANLEYVITDKDVTITSGKSLVGTDSFQVYVSKKQTV